MNQDRCYSYTVKALISRHPRDAKKFSVTGADHSREQFSLAGTRVVRVLRQLPTEAYAACNEHWEWKNTTKSSNQYVLIHCRLCNAAIMTPLNSRRRRQHNVGSPGYLMRNRPRPSINRSMTAASP